MNLKYTLVFVTDHRDNLTWILMLWRRRPPNQGLLNGVGGKIKPGETPVKCAIREVREETGIEVDNIRFAGIVTWPEGDGQKGGMYVYFTSFPILDDWRRLERLQTDEGLLEWFPLDGLDDLDPHMVSNIPHFLADMLDEQPPVEHYCTYDSNGNLVAVEQLPLTIDLTGVSVR